MVKENLVLYLISKDLSNSNNKVNWKESIITCHLGCVWFEIDVGENFFLIKYVWFKFYEEKGEKREWNIL